MISLVRTRTLTDLRGGIRAAESATEAARAEAARHAQEHDLATDAAIRAEIAAENLRSALATATADAARLEGELATLRAQSLLDTEDRQALRTLLRAVRKQNARADRVYALFHHGHLHSIHATVDAAETAAEAEGAPPFGVDRPHAGSSDAPGR